MKKKTNTSREFSKDREFAIILEKIYGEIKTITDGQALMKDSLDSTRSKVGQNCEDITWIRMDVSHIKDDITKINGKIGKIEDDVFKIKGRLTTIEEDTKVIKTDFGKRLSNLEAVK